MIGPTPPASEPRARTVSVVRMGGAGATSPFARATACSITTCLACAADARSVASAAPVTRPPAPLPSAQVPTTCLSRLMVPTIRIARRCRYSSGRFGQTNRSRPRWSSSGWCEGARQDHRAADTAGCVDRERHRAGVAPAERCGIGCRRTARSSGPSPQLISGATPLEVSTKLPVAEPPACAARW